MVRNPWQRLASGFIEAVQLKMWKENQFDLFLENVLTCGPEVGERYYRQNQIESITVHGKVEMDFIGRYENYDADLDFICKKIGIENIVKSSKIYGRRYRTYDYKKIYNDDLIEKVAKLYEKDIAYFGYSF